jgi:hypothetical protein
MCAIIPSPTGLIRCGRARRGNRESSAPRDFGRTHNAQRFAFIPMLYFNAQIFDWRIAVGSLAMMTAIIVAASIMPAIKAARVNPANVLRGLGRMIVQ